MAAFAFLLAAVYPWESGVVVAIVCAAALAGPALEIVSGIVCAIRSDRSRSGAIALIVAAASVAALALAWHRWGYAGFGNDWTLTIPDHP